MSHGLCLTSKGILGSGIPVISLGYLCDVTIDEEVIVVTPPRGRSSGTQSAALKDKKPIRKKRITVVATVCGKKYKETKIVDMKTKVKVKDIKVELGESPQIIIQVDEFSRK